MKVHYKGKPAQIEFNTYDNGNTIIIIHSKDYHHAIFATSPGKSNEPIIHPLLCEFHDWDDYDDIIECLVEADLITTTVYFSYPFAKGNINMHGLTKKGEKVRDKQLNPLSTPFQKERY